MFFLSSRTIIEPLCQGDQQNNFNQDWDNRYTLLFIRDSSLSFLAWETKHGEMPGPVNCQGAHGLNRPLRKSIIFPPAPALRHGGRLKVPHRGARQTGFNAENFS